MMNVENCIYMHKAGVGKLRENCVYVRNIDEVPEFLLEDGAVKANADGSITLHAVECSVTRTFPVYVCFEKVSSENAHKVPGVYGAWPKDNGATTLKVVDGKCYNLPVNIKASLITEKVPEWVTATGFPIERKGDIYELLRTDTGEVRVGRIGKAMWIQHREGKVNILDLVERSALEYIVTEDGKDIGVLTELLADLI